MAYGPGWPETLCRVESRGLDEGKGTEEASVFAAFGKVHCHFLAHRFVFKLTLSVLPPRHGHQPSDTHPTSASVTRSHGSLSDPSSQRH